MRGDHAAAERRLRELQNYDPEDRCGAEERLHDLSRGDTSQWVRPPAGRRQGRDRSLRPRPAGAAWVRAHATRTHGCGPRVCRPMGGRCAVRLLPSALLREAVGPLARTLAEVRFAARAAVAAAPLPLLGLGVLFFAWGLGPALGVRVLQHMINLAVAGVGRGAAGFRPLLPWLPLLLFTLLLGESIMWDLKEPLTQRLRQRLEAALGARRLEAAARLPCSSSRRATPTTAWRVRTDPASAPPPCSTACSNWCRAAPPPSACPCSFCPCPAGCRPWCSWPSSRRGCARRASARPGSPSRTARRRSSAAPATSTFCSPAATSRRRSASSPSAGPWDSAGAASAARSGASAWRRSGA